MSKKKQDNFFTRLGGWLLGQFARRPKPVWILVTADVLLIALSLVVFALFHHVVPRNEKSVGLVSSRDSVSATPVPDDDEYIDDDAPDDDAPAAILAGDLFAGLRTGDFSNKFSGKFTGGDVVRSGADYQSANINVSISQHEAGEAVYYVADIYVRDISYFVTAFANDKFAKGLRERPSDISARVGGIVAINGDYYGARSDGIVIRNGELFRSDPYPTRDVCVLYWDGVMETYPYGKFDAEAAIDRGAYQAWNFGPMLLDESGHAVTKFNSEVFGENPRTALGYFEPGHYCFVVVDGRQETSAGMTLEDLSTLMESLGCVRAYNLDGGNTSVMVDAYGETVNNPSHNGRMSSDIIAVVDSN